GVAAELDALGLQLSVQLTVVLDDAVVDDGHPLGAVQVRMGVAVVRRAVGGPPGVPDTGRAGNRQPGQLLVQVLDPPGLLGRLQLFPDDGHAGRVVAAVLQPAQSLDDDVECLARADITYDPAHRSPQIFARELTACRVRESASPRSARVAGNVW